MPYQPNVTEDPSAPDPRKPIPIPALSNKPVFRVYRPPKGCVFVYDINAPPKQAEDTGKTVSGA